MERVLAEGEGFEPPDASRRQRFSRPVAGVRNTGTYHRTTVKSFTIRNIGKLISIKESPSQWSKIGAKKDDLFLRFFEKISRPPMAFPPTSQPSA